MKKKKIKFNQLNLGEKIAVVSIYLMQFTIVEIAIFQFTVKTIEKLLK